jgi:hypothetical protein
VSTIEISDESRQGPCDCCGTFTRTVWGYVAEHSGTRAAYFARWAEGHPEHGATFLFSVGRWGDGTTPADRVAVALTCVINDGAPGFMVTDAASAPWTDAFLGRLLERSEVVGTPLAQEVFTMVDAVLAQDPRVLQFTPRPSH